MTQPTEPSPALVMGPDGQVYKAPPGAQLPPSYRPLSPEEQYKHQVAKEEAAKGTVGSLESAGSSALNQLLMGVPGAIQDESDTPEEKAHREAVDEYHSTARTIGGIAGFGGSLLAGGEIFKAADLAGQAVSRGILPAEEVAKAGLAAKLAATSASYATQGALMASPQALVQAAWGDPQKAAETLLWGVGAGAVMGGAGELLKAASSGVGDLAGKGAEALLDKSTADTANGVSPLEQFASDRTAKAVGAERSQLNKLSPDRIRDVTSFAHDEGIIQPGMSRADIGKAIDAAHDKYGAQIGDAISNLDEAVTKGTATTDLPDKAIKPGQLGDAIRTALDTPELAMPMNADQRNALEMVVQSANKIQTKSVNGRDVVSFEDAQNFVSSLRKKWVNSVSKTANEGGVKGLETVTPLDQMKAAAYQVARDSVHRAADDVAAASDRPDLVGALAKAKQNYAKVAELDKWAATAERQNAGNRAMSITDWISMGNGPGAMTGSGIGAAIGGMVGGAPGAIVGSHIGKVPGALLDFVAKKWGEDKGLVYLSALAHKAAKDGPEVMSAVMASEGAKRLEATMRDVQSVVKKMAVRGIEATGAAGSEHMQALLGSTQGLTSDQAYSKLGRQITTLATNPAALAQTAGQLAAPFSTTAPEVSDAYVQKMADTIGYLYNALPKAPGPPPPFSPQAWSPTAQDKLGFHDRAEIVSNPMRAMTHVARGTLSDAHLEALKTIYPTVYSMMQQEVLKFHSTHPDVNLPLQERESISKFLGTPLDNPTQIRAMQASYAAQAQGQQPSGSKPTKGKIKDMPSASTSFSATQGPAQPA